MSDRDGGVPIEQFIQALQTQLDRAQSAMAIKARNQHLPLTFAVKDISLDLRAHVDVVKSEIRIRPAAAGDENASTLRFSMTTITKPMIDENTVQMAISPDEPSLKDALGDTLSEEEQRRLEWAGVQNVTQLQELQSREHVIERVSQIPALRLRAALEHASRPFVSRILPERPSDPDGNGDTASLLLRIRGHNLMREGAPRVRIAGEAVQVLKATNQELLIAPLAHQMGGTLVVETAPGSKGEAEFDFYPTTPLTATEEQKNDGGKNGRKRTDGGTP